MKVLLRILTAKVDLAESEGSFSDKSLKGDLEDLSVTCSDTLHPQHGENKHKYGTDSRQLAEEKFKVLSRSFKRGEKVRDNL